MKKIIFFSMILSILSFPAKSQKVISGKSEKAEKIVLTPKYERGIPPKLTSVFSFDDKNNNGLLEAEESANIKIKLTNEGKGAAQGINVKLIDNLNDPLLIITCPKEVALLDPEKTIELSIPVTSNSAIKANEHIIKIVVSEHFGYDMDPIYLILNTRDLPKAQISFSGIEIIDKGEGTSAITEDQMLQAGEMVKVKVSVQNTGLSIARNSTFRIISNDDNIFIEKPEANIGDIKSGEVKSFFFTLSPNKKVNSTEKLPVMLSVIEDSHKGDLVNFQLPIILNQVPSPAIIVEMQQDAFIRSKKARFEYGIENLFAYKPEPTSQEQPQNNQYRGDPLKGLSVSYTGNELQFGNYYALIIGIDKYSGDWPKLTNAVNDAKSIENVIKSKYKFDQVHTLYNDKATRTNIIREFEWLMNNVKPIDNLLIYYSGHGEFNQSMNKGFWVPVDAIAKSTSYYISNNDIQTYLGGIKSRHTLLISDACFSGDILRGNTLSVPFENSSKYYIKINNIPSRKALTSGGIEPVMDGGKEGHSVFSYYLLKTLTDNKSKYFDATQLYESIKIPVVNNSDQTPILNVIKNSGDEGGQFIFLTK